MKLTPNVRRLASKRGLTLIELVVVLAILVALAGLILATFPSLLKRTSGATSATSITDISKAVQVQYAVKLTYPSLCDSLVTPAGATYTALNGGVAAQVTASTFGGNASTFTSAGITQVVPMVSTNSPTFAPNQLSDAISVASGTPCLTITDTNVTTRLRGAYSVSGTPTYYVFGVGNYCSLIGPDSGLSEAPVHSGDAATENPQSTYQRFGIAYLVDNNGLRFLGSVAFTANGIQTAGDGISKYYQ